MAPHCSFVPARAVLLALAVFSPVAAVVAQSGARTGPFADQQRADDLLQRGKVGAALVVYRKLVDDLPGSAVLRYKIALCHDQLGEPQEGVESVQLALRFDPQLLPAQVLGAKLLAAADADEAARCVERALAQRELTGDMAVDLIEALALLPASERAQAVGRELVRRFARHERLLAAAAEAAIARRDLAFAESCYAAWVQANGRNPVALESLAHVQQMRGRDLEAERSYGRLLAVNPSNLRGRAALVTLLEKRSAEPADIAIQQRYLEHYRAVHARANEQATTKEVR